MADRPTTTPFDTPHPFDESCRFEENGIACEWGETYRPGGLHPIQLGDILDDGRYCVIRKIGYGASSTVWLAVDNQMTRFVALKVTMARLSNVANRELSLYQRLATKTPGTFTSTCFAGILDSFQVNGPNGFHTVFVFEPLGPQLWDVLDATPEFQHGSLFDDDDFFRSIPKSQRFPKLLRKRILRNVLDGLGYLHSHGIVHGDIHMGNILVTIRPLECNAGSIADLQQMPEDGEPLRRLDGKQDLWAPPYQLVPAGLLKYSSTELDPYVKIADIGGSFHVDESPAKIVTPPEFRAPETLLGLPVGAGIDIWSFGCLAFLIITGYDLFAPNGYLGSEDAIRDFNLIQFSEVIGPLPETIFRTWTHGASYFAPDRKTRLSEMLGDGVDGSFSFMGRETDVGSQKDESGDEEESRDEGKGRYNEEGTGSSHPDYDYERMLVLRSIGSMVRIKHASRASDADGTLSLSRTEIQ